QGLQPYPRGHDAERGRLEPSPPFARISSTWDGKRMRHGIQDDEDTKLLASRALAVARDHASYRESLGGLCAGSGIPVKRSPEHPQALDTCGNCLGVGLVWRL